MSRFFLFFTVFICSAVSNCFGQAKTDYEWYLSQSRGGLCNESILLFKDSTYCSESGCEASSHFSFGKWEQKKNIIKLTPVNPATFNVILKVEAEKTNDKNLTVSIFDRDGNNITSRINIGQAVEGKGIYGLSLDSSETKRTDFKRNNSRIVLTRLQRVFKQKLEIKVDSSNSYKIYLNVSAYWNFHNNSDWANDGEFSLIRTKDKLTSVVPVRFDDKGNLVPEEYILQKK